MTPHRPDLVTAVKAATAERLDQMLRSGLEELVQVQCGETGSAESLARSLLRMH
jgi:hypothetical protein